MEETSVGHAAQPHFFHGLPLLLSARTHRAWLGQLLLASGCSLTGAPGCTGRTMGSDGSKVEDSNAHPLQRSRQVSKDQLYQPKELGEPLWSLIQAAAGSSEPPQGAWMLQGRSPLVRVETHHFAMTAQLFRESAPHLPRPFFLLTASCPATGKGYS